MDDNARLRKQVETPASGWGTPGLAKGSLPTEFVGDASRRLGWACLFYAGGFTMAYFVNAVPQWIRDGTVAENFANPNTIVACVAISLSLVLFYLTQRTKISPHSMMNLALVYEVVGAFGISMSEFWGIYREFPREIIMHDYVGIPWECVWIMVFPILAPNTPRKTLLASLGAASTGMIVVTLSKLHGETSPDATIWFFLRYFLFSTYLCAILAMINSYVIVGMGRYLQRAYELGSYRLVKRLGVGGMGEVWRAKHRMLARPAAIKLIRPETLGESESSRMEAIRRFEREAQATASLKSQHTIDLYDFGVTNDGCFYYVMELLDGMNFEALVKRFGPVSSARVVHYLRQACRSLMEAHQHGMIHRDIKPANLYTCRLGIECDVVKVLDFGLVKTSREKGDVPQLTMQGIATGTPGYMAPEAALGGKDLDARTDIYSLGCVGYWLMTGAHVFEGDSALATVVQHVQAEPVPPSQRTEMAISPSLEKVILSCLRKDPADRPQSMDALDRLLSRCEIGEVWSSEMAREWWELHLPRAGEPEIEDTDMDDAGSTLPYLRPERAE